MFAMILLGKWSSLQVTLITSIEVLFCVCVCVYKKSVSVSPLSFECLAERFSADHLHRSAVVLTKGASQSEACISTEF